jgi:hypothetical protein
MFRDMNKLVEDADKPAGKLPVTMPSRMTLGEVVANAEQKRKEQEESETPTKEGSEATPGAETGQTGKETPASKETQDTPAKPPQQPPVKPAEKAAAPAAEEPLKVQVKTKADAEREIAEMVDTRLKVAMERLPQAAAPKQEQKQPEQRPEDAYEQSLGEAEKEEIRFAKYAAEKDPSFKDYPKQLIEYYKKTDAHIEKTRKEEPERTFDESDEGWRKWQTDNRPKFNPVVRRRLERQQIMDEAKVAVAAELEPKYAEMAKRQELLEKRPIIQKITEEFKSTLADVMAAPVEGQEVNHIAPIIERVKQAGWGKAYEEDAIIAPIIHRVTDVTEKLAEQYLGLVNKTVEFDAGNADHVWISDFIAKQGKEFAANGGTATVRNGKKFLTRSDYYTVAKTEPERAGEYWTWSDGELLARMQSNAKKNAEIMVKAELDKLAKAGYERKKPAATAPGNPKKDSKPAKEPEAKSSPGAPSSSAPGIAQPSKISGGGLMTADEAAYHFPGAKI